MGSLRSWKNFISGKSDILRAFSATARVFSIIKRSRPAADDSQLASSVPPVQTMLEGLEKLLRRRMSICLIYSGGSPAFYNYMRFFKKRLAELDREELCSVTHFKNADHGFTLLEARDRLINKIYEWGLQTVTNNQ